MPLPYELLDVDTTAVVDDLSRALAASGLTQAAFARSLGTSASRFSTYRSGKVAPTAAFVHRALRIGTALGEARRLGWMSAPSTADAVREAPTDPWRWRLLLQGRDHLRAVLSDEALCHLRSAWEASPGSTGEAGMDALLAALARHEFEQAGRAAPAWSLRARVSPPWQPEHPFLDAERVRERTPAFLADAGIYVPARDLVTA